MSTLHFTALLNGHLKAHAPEASTVEKLVAHRQRMNFLQSRQSFDGPSADALRIEKRKARLAIRALRARIR